MTARTNSLRYLARYIIRPALVEANLLTKKHAGDAVYMATLAEELVGIEVKIAAMERASQLSTSSPAVQSSDCLDSEDWSDANWVRAKSRELGLRLRRIEQSSTEK